MEDLVGKALKNRYQVRRLIGRGGMADVYEVWDEQREAPLALKLLRREISHDRVFLRRFKREATTLAKLQHPNIVRFYGLDSDEDDTFILMDLVDGESLKSEIFRLNSKPMEPSRILEVMRAICSALQYAHHNGYVHSDMKPGNVLINKSGHIFVADFGIARMMDSATATMVGAGTPAYMAPEVIKGQQPTPESDIYALGVILYEMVSGGERPFTGERAKVTGTTGEKVRWEHLNIEPPMLPKAAGALGKQIEPVIKRCLSKSTEARFGSPKELQNTVERCLSDTPRPVLAKEKKEAKPKEHSATEVNVEPLAKAAPKARKATTKSKSSDRRNKVLLTILGAVFVIAVSFALIRQYNLAPPMQDSGLVEIGVLQGHTDQVLDIAWSTDGTLLASASRDGTVRIWDSINLTQLRDLDISTDMQSEWDVVSLLITWSEDGQQLAILQGWGLENQDNSVSDHNTLQIWNMQSGTQVFSVALSEIRDIAWSPNGNRLATVGRSGDVSVWDVSTRVKAAYLEGTGYGGLHLAWSSDGLRLASTNGYGDVRIWDLTTGTKLNLKHEDANANIDCVAWSSDGTRLLTGYGGYIYLWDPVSGNRVNKLEGPEDNNPLTDALENSFIGCSQSISGPWFISAITQTGEVWTWHENGTTVLKPDEEHGGEPQRGEITWSSQDAKGAYITKGGGLQLFDGLNGVWFYPFKSFLHDFHSLAWSPVSQLLATGNSDGTIQIWGPETEDTATFQQFAAGKPTLATVRPGPEPTATEILMAIPDPSPFVESVVSPVNIANAFTAADPDGNTPTTIYSQEAIFYAIVDPANAPDDTTVKASWYAVSAEGIEPNFFIDEASITSGDARLTFDLQNAPNMLWPTGSYRVDLYLNNELDRSLEFTVQ